MLSVGLLKQQLLSDTEANHTSVHLQDDLFSELQLKLLMALRILQLP